MTSSNVRTASVSRATRETNIQVTVTLDGTGQSTIGTGIGFLDHMLTALSQHSSIDLQLTCKGDLHIDDHHTAEDCASRGSHPRMHHWMRPWQGQ